MKLRPLALSAIAAAAIAAIAIPLLAAPVGADSGTTAPATPALNPATAPEFPQCPAIGADTGCEFLITLPSTGLATIQQDGTQGPYDGNDDTLVGVVNNTGAPISAFQLSSATQDIYGFDGDGICSSPYKEDWATGTFAGACPNSSDTSNGYYGGPQTFFTNISGDDQSGTVNFDPLANGASTFFSLENSISGDSLVIPAHFGVVKSVTSSGPYYTANPPNPATPITYQLAVSNGAGSGPGSAAIADSVPAGTTLVAGSNACPAPSSIAPATCTLNTLTSTSWSWDLLNVQGNQTIDLGFSVTPNASATNLTITNTALWSGPGCTSDPIGPGNQNVSTVSPAAAVTPCDTNTTTTTADAPTSVVVTASPTTSVYGATPPPTVTPGYSPTVVPTTAPTCATTVTATTPVGAHTGTNTCSGAVLAGYTFTYVAGTGTVTPALLTVTAGNGTFVYGGGATPALRSHFVIPTVSVASITGFVNSQTVGVLTTTPTCGTTATASSPVGSYPTTCSGGVAPNYTFAYVAGTMTVTPAALTITASSAQANIGAAIPAITPSYAGFVNSDTASSLSTAPTCSTTATSTSVAGTYPTSCTGAVDPNYVISYVPGTLGLTAAPVTAPAVVTPAAPAAVAATAASTAPAIAFTGAFLDQEWMIGVGALLAGIALLLISRRLRAPKHAAGR